MVLSCKILSQSLSIDANHPAWFEGKERSPRSWFRTIAALRRYSNSERAFYEWIACVPTILLAVSPCQQ